MIEDEIINSKLAKGDAARPPLPVISSIFFQIKEKSRYSNDSRLALN